ncbi:DUF6973 domain-containing protein [Nocardia wallacei]|uniref:DUF6973 domain-containing protein n=1 Tax=Nocardia wallacei TaxID=480035 RepID=UPI002454EFCD|nr:hypothetical protein [Nocardia wallacei]
MSVESLTVPTVLSWDLSPAKATATTISTVSQAVDQEAKGAADKVDRSRDYFEGEAGDAARTRAITDRDTTFTTADVLEEMGKMCLSLAEDIADNIDTIRDKKAEAEESRWDLFVADDGEVLSHKSNWETSKEYFPFGSAAVAAKELTTHQLTSAIQGALDNIQVADQEGAEKFVRLLEKLSDSVKEGLVVTPDDPKLAAILRDFQTDASTEEPQLWPTGWELDAIRVFKSDFEPSLMTEEEIDAMKTLMRDHGAWGVWQQYQLTEDAKNAAEEQFPASTADGQGDAFRHAYWNALMTQKYGEDWTETFTTAHEKTGGNTPQREAMDLYNNQVGRNVALANPDASPEELQQLIKTELSNGNLTVIENKTPDGQPKPAQITWSNRVGEAQTGPPPGVGVPLPGKK